jgi:hypothetical protein
MTSSQPTFATPGFLVRHAVVQTASHRPLRQFEGMTDGLAKSGALEQPVTRGGWGHLSDHTSPMIRIERCRTPGSLAQYSPLITKYEPRIVPASFDFCRANLNEPSSAGTSIPSESLNPAARFDPSSVYKTLIESPLA